MIFFFKKITINLTPPKNEMKIMIIVDDDQYQRGGGHNSF